MDSKVCVLSLLVAYLSYANGAAIPSEFDMAYNQVQDFLANPELWATAVGMIVKRDTGDWDMVFDMEGLGLSFKLKYVDPSDPLKGGHVHMKFPAHRFVKAASFDDVELKFTFKGGEAVDGLFELKFDYKFIQKFQFFADHPQQGIVTMYRKMEGGKWRTKMSLESNTNKLFEVNMESDHSTNFHATAKLDHDNTWEMTINRVPGKSINIGFVHNGIEYSVIATLDKAAMKADIKVAYPGHRYYLEGQINPDNKWGIKVNGGYSGPLGFEMLMDKDFKSATLWIYFREETYALVKLTGDAEMTGKKMKYIAKYRFMDGPGFQPMQKTEGSANINFDGISPKQVLAVNYTEGNVASFPPPYIQTPSNGKDGKLNFQVEPIGPGFKYLLEITHDGHIVYKQDGVRTLTTIGNGVDDVKTISTELIKTEVDKASPLYKFLCSYTYPVPCATSSEVTKKFILDVANTNYYKNFLGIFGELQWNKFSYEEDIVYGGEKIMSMKIDTTVTPYVFTWEILKAPAHYPFEGKVGWIFEPELEGFKSFFKFEKNGKTVFSQLWNQKNINDAQKFEWAEDVQYFLDEEFYKLNKWYGRLLHPINHWKVGTASFKFSFDKQNKNMFFNQISLEDKVMLDGALYHHWKLNTFNSSYEFNYNFPVAPGWWPLEGHFDLHVEPSPGGAHIIYKYDDGGKTYFDGDHDFAVISNVEKFEASERSKITMDEDSVMYAMHCRIAYPVPCFKVIELTRKLFVDKKNKNFFFNKMTYDSEEKLDGEIYQQFKVDTVNSPYQFIWSEPKSPKWTLQKMFGLKRLKVTVDHKAEKELVIKSNLADMKLTIRRKPNIFMEFKRNEETYLKFNTEMNENEIKTDMNIHLYFPSGSKFCSHQSDYEGCYNKWEGDFKVFVDLKNMNHYINPHSINVFVKKDIETIFEFEQSINVSPNSPYVLKINAPSLMPMLFDDSRRHSLDVTTDYQEGKMIHIQSNAPEMSSFMITIDGAQKKLELNGKEIGLITIN